MNDGRFQASINLDQLLSKKLIRRIPKVFIALNSYQILLLKRVLSTAPPSE